MLQISSSTEAIKDVEKWVDDLSNELDISRSIYGNVLISVVEAVNNSIIHGNKQDASKSVDIEASFTDKKDQLTIKISDQGEGFDFDHVPDPTVPDRLESLNGRGIFLMHSLSDEIAFHKEGQCVELKFNM